MEPARDVWDGAIPPGGYVCGTCGQPTESEPCDQHQPSADTMLLADYIAEIAAVAGGFRFRNFGGDGDRPELLERLAECARIAQTALDAPGE